MYFFGAIGIYCQLHFVNLETTADRPEIVGADFNGMNRKSYGRGGCFNRMKARSYPRRPRLRRSRWWETAAEFSIPGTSTLLPAPPDLEASIQGQEAGLDVEEPKI